ncbi:Glucosamine 6-phosphate N-acetyltransferase 1 [Vanrija pseudolonga]|uniref:glucosamine-phosphate N-acetyltransferase n=1 Tax=Vanrija pseudolonga TaxID=143232 RepID=A0AAF0YCN1_9TREE|nr:Glucosamine 6-phosphate N-acetyltransferase 1 [Vanrija pseudolonga]
MAYAYPAEPVPPSPARKGGDADADIVREFKRKLAEADENYISYFNERIKIEQSYIDQLGKLHAKTVGVDSVTFDATRRDSNSSARRAWLEVRDYSQREIDSRSAFINALRDDVVGPLTSLRDTQARIRQRIREDLKTATDAYEDYAFSKVPKLKRSYDSKCQALVDFKKQEHAIAMQAKLLSEASPVEPSPAGDKPHPFSYTVSSDGAPPSSPPYSTSGLSSSQGYYNLSSTSQTSLSPSSPGSNLSAQLPAYSPVPSSGLERRGTLSSLAGRARSGSGSGLNQLEGKSKEVLSDIAHHGKKGFTALKNRFGGDREGKGGGGGSDAVSEVAPSIAPDERNTTPSRRGHHQHHGSIGSSKGTAGTLKSVKVKRDAEEADKAYRQGVFHCESLRLRREKLQQSAITSLGSLNDDLNATIKITMRAFTDATYATSFTLAQATEVITKSINEIHPDADSMRYRSRLPKVQRNAPILYSNFYVGPCRSLIFGVSLTDYDFARGEGGDHGSPPLIVEKSIAWIDERGLDAEGIYRISGRIATVKEMVQRIEQDEDKFRFTPDNDVFSVSVVLKQYLRELPEPLFPMPHSERTRYTQNRDQHIANDFTSLRGRLRRLPPIHQTTVRAIIEHLSRIAARSNTNKMSAKNLAVVFNSVVFGSDAVPTNGNALTMHLEKDTVLEDMITYSDLLFKTPDPMAARQADAESINSFTSYQTDPAAQAVVPAHPHYEEEEDIPIFTPDAKLVLLFSPFKIPGPMRDAVGEDYHVRPLAADDFIRSYFGLLSSLSTAPPLAPSVFTALFNALKASIDTYFIVVIVEKSTDQIVASGTLIVERKFIHAAGLAGHIEDIVVSPNAQGRGLGGTLVTGLREMATRLNCYKVILDCKDPKVGFYEKCGFDLRGRQMAFYVNPDDAKPKAAAPPLESPSEADLNSPARTEEASTTERDDATAVPDTQSVADTLETASTSSGVTYHFPTGTSPEQGRRPSIPSRDPEHRL